MKYLISFLILFCGGCTSISYGPMTIRSVGVDATFDDAQWAKVGADGKSSEVFVIHGVKRNATESTHTVCNTALALAGALIGSPAGLPGAASGAVIGGGSGELLQTIKEYFSKTSTTNATETVK